MPLYPAIMAVGLDLQSLSGRRKVAALSELSRQALHLSAAKSGVALGDLCQDDDGVPLPCNGVFWSVSHKPRYVAGVVAKGRAGIDIEEIVPRRTEIFGYVAQEAEWELFGGHSWLALYRCWTAKEAVVKSTGRGLAGLKSCRVLDVPDDKNIILLSDGEIYHVEELRHDDHIAAVIKGQDMVEWVLAP